MIMPVELNSLQTKTFNLLMKVSSYVSGTDMHWILNISCYFLNKIKFFYRKKYGKFR